jgi:hypothetical protein
MKKKEIINRLRISMIVGAVVDLLMVIIFFIPALRILIFGENQIFHTQQYEWGMRLVGSLGAAWTVLLFWASKKPLERKDVLFITVFPLMFIAYLSTLYGFFFESLSVQFFILFTFITFAHCPYFLYIWLRALGINNE